MQEQPRGGGLKEKLETRLTLPGWGCLLRGLGLGCVGDGRPHDDDGLYQSNRQCKRNGGRAREWTTTYVGETQSNCERRWDPGRER